MSSPAQNIEIAAVAAATAAATPTAATCRTAATANPGCATQACPAPCATSQRFAVALQQYAADIVAHPRVQSQVRFMQHGTTSVLEHEHNVARMALQLADALHLDIDEKSMLRGALLHDYFLYDWHDPNNGHPKHATEHPQYALANALEDFDLNETERDVIVHHMFPLCPPPRTREGFLVCLADKIVALDETVRPRAQHLAHLFSPKGR